MNAPLILIEMFIYFLVFFSIVMVIFSLIKKKIFFMGNWYFESTDKSKFWQTIIAYIIFLAFSMHMIFYEFGK